MLTPDQINAMQPGWELNQLVHEKVMGKKGGSIKSYSEDIAAAMEIVEKCKSKKPPKNYWWYEFSCGYLHPNIQYFARFKLGAGKIVEARGETIAEAICKAALLAVEGYRVI